LIRRLQKEDISKEDLQKNLEYAASVLETVLTRGSREIPDIMSVFLSYKRLN
jgi:hypothetical protein